MLDSDEYAFRVDCGSCKPVPQLTMADKDEIVTEVCVHYLVMRVLGEIDQFSRGLKETLQFEHLITVA